MSVLVVGTLALDDIETPWENAKHVLGGSSTYIALAARLLTAPVGIVAVVGGDFPDKYRQLLQSSDLDLTGLETLENQDTFAWGGRYRTNMNIRDTTFTHLNALAEFNPLVPDAYVDSNVICLGNLPPKTQSDTLDQVSDKVFSACDTMNYWIENMREELDEVLSRIDCLLINDEEARQITGEDNLYAAGRQVLELGPKILIIKKGEHGAILFIEEQVFIVPSFPLKEVRDPTGAGDVFLGAFAGSLSNESVIGLDALKRAVVYGSTVASFCVENLGPYELADLTNADIQERSKLFRGVTEWPALHERL